MYLVQLECQLEGKVHTFMSKHCATKRGKWSSALPKTAPLSLPRKDFSHRSRVLFHPPKVCLTCLGRTAEIYPGQWIQLRLQHSWEAQVFISLDRYCAHTVCSTFQRHSAFCDLPVMRNCGCAENQLLPKQSQKSFPLRTNRIFCFLKVDSNKAFILDWIILPYHGVEMELLQAV